VIDSTDRGCTYIVFNVGSIIDTGVDLEHEDLNFDVFRGFNAFT
jgi:hypothetical protein